MPYFFSYKAEFFFILKQSQNLDPSNKLVIDHWGCLGREKLVIP